MKDVEKVREALRRAMVFASIANDWNFYEAEIDGVFVSTYTIIDELKDALASLDEESE